MLIEALLSVLVSRMELSWAGGPSRFMLGITRCFIKFAKIRSFWVFLVELTRAFLQWRRWGKKSDLLEKGSLVPGANASVGVSRKLTGVAKGVSLW